VAKRSAAIEHSTSEVIQALLESLKAHDPYTYGHCRRVGRNALLFAEALGLNPFEQKIAEAVGSLHDIGKIGVPEGILRKQDRLSESEDKLMREHVAKGIAILRPLSHIPFFKAVSTPIRHHHERIDGKGYPDGLKGDDIPFLAKLITIVDALDAMTTNRPYREGNSIEYAYEELKKHSGTQFDAQLVETFLKEHPAWGEIPEEISAHGIAQISRKSG